MPFENLAGGPGGLQIIDPVLSNLARQYKPKGFIYPELVAFQPVEYNIGQYPVFNLAKFYTARGDSQVADDAATPTVDFEWSTEFFNCQDYRLKTRVTRKELLQAHPALRLEVSKVSGLLGIMALEREKRLAKVLRSEANGGKLSLTAATVTQKWDKGDTTVKIQKDLQNASNTVYKAIGRRPNTLILTERIAIAITQDPTIQELIKYLAGVELVEVNRISSANGDASPFVKIGSAVLPKKLFGFNVVAADGVLENTAQEGEAAKLSEVWGNSVRLLYVNSQAQWGEPTVVYSFRGRVTGAKEEAVQPAAGSLTQLEPGGIGAWAIVDRWQEPDPPAENIRVWETVDEKVVAPQAGIEIEEVLGTP